MGHLLEPIAAYWYQQKTGNTVYNDTNLYQHADHPWALADFDLRFVRKEDLLSAFSKDIRLLMLNCPPCHIQQLPDLSVAHVHEVRQQDHVVLLPQELGQRRRKAVIVDGDVVSKQQSLARSSEGSSEKLHSRTLWRTSDRCTSTFS